MYPIVEFPHSDKEQIRFVLTDIDDTLTFNGRLPSGVFSAMERLQDAGIRVIPITGRPAGWCDHIARMWPVDALVGENGAFYFCYDTQSRTMIRCYWKDDAARRADRRRLTAIRDTVLKAVPGCRVAADQAYREADLAIDFCEDVSPLGTADIDGIVACFTDAGARAKVSSIHVNGWYGDYDKLSMTRRLLVEIFKEDMDAAKDEMVFVGDSPNDAAMFAYFPHSVGVANVRRFAGTMAADPVWVTRGEGGHGFAEMVDILLDRYEGRIPGGGGRDPVAEIKA
jgi:HAD superfamily hydrolase (TIGR01484 family)